jgi:hypothetical protein
VPPAALAMAAGGTVQASSSGDRQFLAELLQVRTAVRQYGVNLNQIAAKLNSGGEAPVWMQQAVAGGDRALASVDAAARLLARRLS